MTDSGWQTIEVRIPPDDSRFPDGWWVNTRTGECMNGGLRPVPATDEMRARAAELDYAMSLNMGEGPS